MEKPRNIIANPEALPLAVGKKRNSPKPAIIKIDMFYMV